MKKLSLALVTLTLAATSAFAQNPDDIHLGNPAYGGTGCPAGTASATLSPDAQSLSILFDQFVVQAGPSTRNTLDRKNCDIAIPLHVPQGWSVGFVQLDYRGFAGIPAGANGRLTAQYFLAGSRGISRTQTFYGPTNQDYVKTDNLTVQGDVWSRCGVDVNLRTSASIMVTNRSYSEDAMLTLDSIDLTSGLIYQLQWKRCN